MIVGRERELQAIDGAIAAAGSGKSTALLLVGDPGIGKSTLLAAARDQAVASGLQILRGRDVELRDELTPRELGIALRVAEGRTNPEVAAELFVSRKTVEHHLSQVYRKLGVRSRTELARELAPAVAAESPGLEATMVAE